MSVLVVDNYDSFTYNLVHVLEKIANEPVEVVLNDKIDLPAVSRYSRIVISPGPGIPSESGLLSELIKTYAGKIPMLGVCLGHQAIAECFGGTLLNLNDVFHGVASRICVTQQDAIFNDVPDTFIAGRYHSWVVNKPLPAGFAILAEDENGYVMACKNSMLKVYGIQFHPESILTPVGEKILRNWIKISESE